MFRYYSDMKITDIRTMRLIGPRMHMVGGGVGTTTKMLVRVDTDSGVYGLGEVQDFMGVREAVEYVRGCLLGRDPFAGQPHLHEMLYGTLPPHSDEALETEGNFQTGSSRIFAGSPHDTPTGPIIWAMSGVDIALCDLAGKALGTPCYNLLGGKFRDTAHVYLDRSSPLDKENLDAWKQMGNDAVKDGFDFIKFDTEQTAPELTSDVRNRSLPSRQIGRIVERLGAVRDAVGPEVEISLDCHRLYDVPSGIRLAQALAPLRLYWLEDPTSLVNFEACAQVRSKSPIPICTGETLIAEQMRMFIDHKACDIIHPDIMFCGGMHGMLQIAQYALLHELPVAMHGNGGGLATVAAAHVAAAIPNFLGLEYHWIETDWVANIVRREGTSLFADGHVPLTDAPGLGLELNKEVCREYLGPGEQLF